MRTKTIICLLAALIALAGCGKEQTQTNTQPSARQPEIVRTSATPAISAIDAELIVACEKDDINKIRELLDKGANVNVSKKDGASPMDLAKGQKNKDVIALLEKAGAK